MSKYNNNTKFILLNIINTLEFGGVTESKEIVKIGEILSDPESIRGLKRSITMERKKAKRDFEAAFMPDMKFDPELTDQLHTEFKNSNKARKRVATYGQFLQKPQNAFHETLLAGLPNKKAAKKKVAAKARKAPRKSATHSVSISLDKLIKAVSGLPL